MPAAHILVLAVDGLRASALGAYGNTAFPTPTLDRLAAESFLLDACFAEASRLGPVYGSLWQSAHPLRPDALHADPIALPKTFSARGYASTLVTDEPMLKSLAGAAAFDRCVEVAEVAAARADELSQTSLARLFAAACEAVEETMAAAQNASQLTWIHSRGMFGPWDAPLELQTSLLDEDDPAPYDAVEPPDFVIAEADDPDAAFVCGCAYAAQVMVLDACVDALLTAIHETWPAGGWLLAFVGTRGMPLGEHKKVGGVDDRLYAEQLHVPLLLRMPNEAGRLARTGQLTTHADLLPTLLAHVEAGAPAGSTDGMDLGPLTADPCAAWRDAMLSVAGDGGGALRTYDWTLRSGPTADVPGDATTNDAAARRELYVRPDDRWEANDVAALCPDVVDMLAGAAREQAEHIRAGRPMSRAWLPQSVADSRD